MANKDIVIVVWTLDIDKWKYQPNVLWKYCNANKTNLIPVKYMHFPEIKNKTFITLN